MTPMIKKSHLYYDPDETIIVMVKLKQVMVPYIELILYNNKTNKLPSRLKGCDDMNPPLLSEHDHQIILEKLKEGRILIMTNMWGVNITTM